MGKKYRLLEDANGQYIIQRKILLFWVAIWDSDNEPDIITIHDAREQLEYFENRHKTKILTN